MLNDPDIDTADTYYVCFCVKILIPVDICIKVKTGF